MANEYDVVVVGSGASGLSAAVHAHDLGLRVVILEAYHKIGGSTAFSAGQVWAGKNHAMLREGMNDTFEETKAYVRSINHASDKLNEKLLNEWVTESPRVLEDLEKRGIMKWDLLHDFPDYYYPQVKGSKPQGRYLAASPLNGAELGELRSKILYSPHHPPGPSYAEVFSVGGDSEKMDALVAARQAEDILTMGTGIVAHLLLAAKRRGLTVLTSHRADKLLKSKDTIVGLECATPSGRLTFLGSVVLATGSYDWNEDLVKEFSSLRKEETGSVAPPGIRGDGHTMARDVGADMITLPLSHALHIPGYLVVEPNGDDPGYRNGVMMIGRPHSILVDATGKRFADDSFYEAVSSALSTGKAKSPFYLVWDENHHEKYGLFPVPPAKPYPKEMNVKQADTLDELAHKINVDPQTFTATIERWNNNTIKGQDPEFHRGENDWAIKFVGDASHKPNPLLGPIERGPFYAMNWRLINTGIGNGGVKTELSGQVLDTKGAIIPGLYAIGVVSTPNMMGSGYNSGYSICRGLTYGYLATEHIKKQAQVRANL